MYFSPNFWWWFNLSWFFNKMSIVVTPESYNSFALAGPIPLTLVNSFMATEPSSLLIWTQNYKLINTYSYDSRFK